MPVETIWQKRIIDSLKNQGGHGRKWASGFQVGPPDLVLSHPDIGTFLMEVKREIRATKEWGTCRVRPTELQKIELSRYVAAGTLGMVGIVVEVKKGPVMLYVTSHLAAFVNQNKDVGVPWLGAKKGFDVVGAVIEWCRRGVENNERSGPEAIAGCG